MTNFVKTGRFVAQILRFFIFRDGGRPPSSISLGHMWTTHGEYLVVPITDKFSCDRCSSFDNINASIFVEFGRKCLFIPQYWGGGLEAI